MILPFTLDRDSHIYNTPGRYTLATSDVVDLVGLSDLSQVPSDALRFACHRGKCLHKAIERYEMGEDWQTDFPAEFQPYLDGYFVFRDEHEFQMLPPMEKEYVYLHEGSDQAIGATVDMRILLGDDLYILDLKSVHPASGKALKQKKLAWRLQTESYATVTHMDEAFLAPLKFKSIKRAVLHIHPKLTTKGKRGYEFHPFPQDDSLLWDGAVRMAFEKVAAGIVPKKREASSERPTWDDELGITDADLPAWARVKQQFKDSLEAE